MTKDNSTAYGFCECGCGRKTNIAPFDRAARGWIKGEPKRFIKGHGGSSTKHLALFEAKRSNTPPDSPNYGLCECGCGKQTNIAKQTTRKYGWVKGKPLRYIEGHGTRGRTGNFGPRRRPAAERFWEHVDRDGPLPEFDPTLGHCWLWTGFIQNNGYANFSVEPGKPIGAHRFSHLLAKGPIPDDFEVDHLCRVRHCVNPNHLQAVTRQENQHRGFGPAGINSRKTHCGKGHPLVAGNLVSARLRKGQRACLICAKESSSRWAKNNAALIAERKRYRRQQQKAQRATDNKIIC